MKLWPIVLTRCELLNSPNVGILGQVIANLDNKTRTGEGVRKEKIE